MLEHCRTLNTSISKEQAIHAEQTTRGQAKCKIWMRLRTGRVTASKAHQVCHTNPAQPALGLINNICTPSAHRKETASMRWRIDNEKKAQDVYARRMVQDECHEGFRLEQCGLFINPLYPFFGASPDGMRFCECHGRGCVEVKCPATKASLTIKESCEDPAFCLQKTGDEIKLKTIHPYYTQAQMQIFVTEAQFCDFVVWTPKDIFIQRIEPDIDFWEEMVPKMQHFFNVAILPELVGHSFSRPRPQALQLSPSEADGSNKTNTVDKLFWYCKRGEEEEDMVARDNEN